MSPAPRFAPAGRCQATLTKHETLNNLTIQCIRDDGHDRLISESEWIDGKDPRLHEFRDRWVES